MKNTAASLNHLAEALRVALAKDRTPMGLAFVVDSQGWVSKEKADSLAARVAELEAVASLSRTEAIADVGDWLEETGDQGAAYMVRTCEIPAARDMRLIAVEDPHDSPLHHDYRTGRDLPEVTQ